MDDPLKDDKYTSPQNKICNPKGGEPLKGRGLVVGHWGTKMNIINNNEEWGLPNNSKMYPQEVRQHWPSAYRHSAAVEWKNAI